MDLNALTYVLIALDIILGISVVVLIFLHSGKDAGLSTMFGGSGGIGGTGVVQKNLDRLTVIVAAVFIVVTVALAYLV